MVFAQETESGRAWAESKIKSLTGGDPITARFMREDFFTYAPRFKLLISDNHQPKLKNVDEAIMELLLQVLREGIALLENPKRIFPASATTAKRFLQPKQIWQKN